MATMFSGDEGRDRFMALLDSRPAVRSEENTRLVKGVDLDALKNKFIWGDALADLQERGNSLHLEFFKEGRRFKSNLIFHLPEKIPVFCVLQRGIAFRSVFGIRIRPILLIQSRFWIQGR